MRKVFLMVAGLALTSAAYAQDVPLWMRHCQIAPNGQAIAFAYKGDIYTIPATGGKATQITSNAAFDSYPVWSPDSKSIAFASAREGSVDVYVVSANGGTPTRLTTHSGNEFPMAFLDNEHVLFSSALMPEAKSLYFPSAQFPQTYCVSTHGGRPTLFSSVPMEEISVSKDGKRLLFQDKKGYEDAWRKHHTSSITRDIWMADAGNAPHNFRRLTVSSAEDRNPVWAPAGDGFFYLSEQDGDMNVYKRGMNESQGKRLTDFQKNPVRFLSVAENGLLCFGYNGEIYTLREGEQPRKLAVEIVADKEDRDLYQQLKSSGATEISLSPNGKEVAFVLRGDVFVTSTDYGTTRQITDTPQQERSIQFSPDGRNIVYASERNGLWQIYQTSLTNKADKYFTYAGNVKEERLTHSDVTSFQPQYSPDGKEVAFLENRTTIRVLNLATKKVRTVMDGKLEYSYSDGDQWYQWSPDSRWIVSNYIGWGGWNNKDVALVNASGNGEVVNLTESGYNDGGAKWVLGGKAIMWESDRAGYRSHGSWGAETDYYLMFLDLDAYEKFQMTKEEAALAEEMEKEAQKEDKKNDKKDTKKGKDDKKKEDVKPLVFDLSNRKDRIVRLTMNSSRLGDAWLNEKGDKLYYLTSFEDDYDLWELDLKEHKTKILVKDAGAGQLQADKEGKYLYLSTNNGIKKIELEKGTAKSVNFNLVFNYRPADEREYIFDHVWQQVKDKFYMPDLHKADWEYYRTNYKRFLPHINNNFDFQDMLSELLGELNGSHTGARYYHPGATLATASLGVFFDSNYKGKGLRIEEIIAKSPLTLKKNDVTAGCVIESIDGKEIGEQTDYYPLLDGKAGKTVRLSVYNPQNGKRFEVITKAISKGEENELLYKRWVERNRKMVDQLSGGKVAYVHVKGMDSPSFRTVYSELLSEANRKKVAVIVDTRHNGGGWLHDDLVTLLSGKEYQRFMPRGQYIGSDPFNKWTKPSCVLVCEDNYSNAHGFPWLYKELGIGKLIGTPVPGTMTAVWWERQIDPTIVFGIPQVGCMDMRGNYLENQLLTPDIEVYNSPEQMLNGDDAQLKRAVDEMLKTTQQ